MKEDLSNNELEEQLKREADGFSLSPQEQVWDRISDQLHPRHRRRSPLWAAAALLLLLPAAYFIWHDRTAQDSAVSREAVPAGRPATEKAPAGPKPEERPAPVGADKDRPSGSGIVLQEGTAGTPPAGAPRTSSGHPGRLNREFIGEPPAPGKGNGETPVGAFPGGDYAVRSFLMPAPLSVERINEVRVPVQVVFPGFRTPAEQAPASGLAAGEQAGTVDRKSFGGKKGKQKASFEVFFNPGFGYRTLSLQAHPAQRQMDNMLSGFAVIKDNKIDQKPEWNVSGGFRGIFPLGKAWQAETGLSLQRVGYRVKAFGTYPAYVRTDGSATVSNAMASPGSAARPQDRANSFFASTALTPAVQEPAYIQSHYLYGELPLLIGRQLGHPDKVHFTLGIGGSLLYLINSSAIIFSPASGRYFKDENILRPFNSNLRLEAGAVFPLSPSVNLIVGPSVQYQVFSTYKGYPQVKEHLYFPGMKAGLQWHK